MLCKTVCYDGDLTGSAIGHGGSGVCDVMSNMTSCDVTVETRCRH